MDTEKIDMVPEWKLPVPNQAAAYKSLGKYGKPTVNMANEDVLMLNEAYEYMSRQFYPYMKDSRVVSLEEAVSRLDMSSSSGCPFNEEFVHKRELFDGDPKIKEWLESDFDRLAWDPLWTTVFSSSLKEELRPLEKIAENSIRTFAAGAVDATVHGNRLFVDMNEKMYGAHLVSASTIGMTPLKGNWDKLFKKLNAFHNGYALDESQYDSSIREFLMWACAKFRWSCLRDLDRTPANLQRIKTYYRNLVNTLILTPEGVLILKKLGNPSGSVNTVTDNTLILYMLMAYAWIKTASIEMRSYQNFEIHTAKALLGDDNTWTVSDRAHVFYNGRTVIEVWKSVGVTTTTDSLEPRLPEDLDFLSAHTVFLKGRAVPLYDRNKLMQSLLHAPQLHITPETTLQRVTCLLQVGWTDYPFRKFCRDLIDYLLITYDHLLFNDERWIMAKCQIQTDEFYYSLFTGEKRILHTQSYQETQERYIKLDKEASMASKGTKPMQKNQRKRRNQQRRGPKKGTVIVVQKPAKRANRAGPRRQRRGKGGGGPSGLGRTSFGQTKPRSIVVANEEFVGAVTVAAQPNFNNTPYPINPGQALLFPWLSKQAAQWEKYQFRKLEFFYRREVSEFATAGQAGKVIFSVDFDASDPPPASKQQMEDTIPHRDAMPCENFSLDLPARELHGSNMLAKYVRIAGLPGGSDIKTYDVGNLNVATQGVTSNVEVGELRVRYVCEFMVPVLENSAGAPANNQVALFSQSNVASSATGVPFNPAIATVETNGLGAVNNNGGNPGNILLPAGNYLVDVDVSCVQSATGLALLTTGQITVFGTPDSPLMTCGIPGVATMQTATCLHVSQYVAVNGSQAIAIALTNVFTAGAPTVYAAMRITAV